MNNSRSNFCSCPDPVLPLARQSFSNISFVIAQWHKLLRWARQCPDDNAAKYPLWLGSWQHTGSGSDGPGVITDRVLPDRYLSLSVTVTLSPPHPVSAHSRPDCPERTTPQGRHRLDSASVTSLSQNTTSGFVSRFVTLCHLIRVSCHEWNDLSSRDNKSKTNDNSQIEFELCSDWVQIDQ